MGCASRAARTRSHTRFAGVPDKPTDWSDMNSTLNRRPTVINHHNTDEPTMKFRPQSEKVVLRMLNATGRGTHMVYSARGQKSRTALIAMKKSQRCLELRQFGTENIHPAFMFRPVTSG